MTNPADSMRSSILECSCYPLQEQAGMFCDALDQLISSKDGFDGSDYIFCRDEPYELHFEWYLRECDVKCGLTVYADPDDTEWFVVSDGGRKRIRRRVDREDVEGSAEMFLREVLSVMGRE